MRVLIIFVFLFLGTSFSVSAQWQVLPGNGKAKRISVDASDGTQWVIGMNNGIFKYKNGRWSEYPGGGRGHDLCVYRNTPYVIGLDNQIHRGTGSGWKVLAGGGKAKRIAVDASNGKLWVIGTNNGIYSYSGSAWKEYPGGGRGTDIGVYKGTPYVIGMNKGIHKGKGSGWQLLPGGGKATNLDVDGSNGRLIVTGTDTGIYYYTSSGWKAYSGNGKAIDVCAFNSKPFVLGLGNQIFSHGASTTGTPKPPTTTQGNKGWIELPGGGRAKQLTIDESNNRAWVIGTNNGIYYYDGSSWKEYPGAGRGYDISVYKNTPYVIGLDNRLYRGTGSGWKVTGQTKGKSIHIDSSNGRIWIVGMNDGIFYLVE